MITNDIIVYDFETGSKNRWKTQPVQLAAVAIDIIRLEVRPNSEFESLIKPELDDEKALALGIDPLEEDALKKNGKTREELAKAPELSLVWDNFVNYVKQYNPKPEDVWKAPAAAGYNNSKFDDIIIWRLCQQFGPYDEQWQEQKLFHPVYNFDVMRDVQNWFHNLRINNTDSISFDAMRDYLGLSKEGAHDALVDVRQTAAVLIRFLKLYRHFTSGDGHRIKFKGAFAQ